MIRYPHGKRKQKISIGKDCSGIEDKSVIIDNSGDIIIGDFVIFSSGCRIYTHSHYIDKSKTILHQTKERGVKISSLVIGDDVYFGANSIVLESVTNTPKGCVIAAGAVLTKNPMGEYEIWAGNPAKKLKERK
jgi:acetyltransferase-like isoleucine patch superfamily enzyme